MTPAQSRDTAAATGARRGMRLPGVVPAFAIAVCSGLAFPVWGLPRLLEPAPDTAANGSTVLAPVAASDLEGALSTMNVPTADRIRADDKDKACNEPLAWVSVAAAPGHVGGKIRLRSGRYFSPTFTLGAQPVRIARTLLERAREAQALRIGPLLADGEVDLTALTLADIDAAIARDP